MTPRDGLRTNWQISFNNKLREMGLIEEILSIVTPGDLPSRERHKSPLIRALCRRGSEPFASASEVFIITYLLQRPEAGEIIFKDRWDLKIRFEEEQKNGALEEL